ncbi:MAG TPA: DUF4232 domain-containing protein [Patescibacteria group bacterium]|nr:DUF4232 domain-containing protein [Patescibacteria group bacterium]
MTSTRRKRQAGNALVAGLVVLVILIGAGGVGYIVWHRHHTGSKHPSGTTASANAPATKTTTSKPALKPCASSDMTLAQGAAEGTAGTIYKHAVITNNGAASCTLAGYPSVSMTDAGSIVLGSSATDNPLYSPATITLGSGGQAHVVLGFPQAGNFSDPNSCTAASVNLQLYLPDDTTPLTTAWVDHRCPGFSVTVFQSGA